MAFDKKIEVCAGGIEWKFNVNAQSYNKYINSLGKQVNIVQASTNFLTSTIDKEQRDDFIEFVKRPGAPTSIVGDVIEEYQEDFEVSVKK